MLTSLVIKNFILIEDLELFFAHRLSVLTGETGAGKSILLDAVGFVLGSRAESSLVGANGDTAVVSATFEIGAGHPVRSLLDENGIIGSELVFRRTLTRDGKGKMLLNDMPVTVTLAKSIGAYLVEIHGQFDNHRLLDPSTHIAVLDEFGGIDAGGVAVAYSKWQIAMAEHARAREEFEKAKADEDYLRHNLDELAKLNPSAGEEELLDARRHSMMAGEKVRTAIADALANISRFGPEPSSFISGAARILERADVPDITAMLDSAASQLMDAVERLTDLSAAADGDNLDDITDRLFKIRELARKHRVKPDELPGLLVSMRKIAEGLENSDGFLRGLAAKEEVAKAEYDYEAAALTNARQRAAETLAERVLAELAPLKLGGATFRVNIAPVHPRPNGVDDVCFVGSMNVGAREGLLHKIASGGELARLTLALKVVTMDSGSADTMIFDEVDTGISGATAAAVGERLARLGANLQTLVITHSPQVAARGANHYRVSKSYNEETGRTTTLVEALATRGRVLEVARIISGDKITQEAINAAESLINN